jgi:arginine deiminase
MSEATMHIEQLKFAKEFLQVFDSLADADESVIPFEIQQSMAFAHLDEFMEINDLSFLELLFGLVKVIDITTVTQSKNDLFESIDHVITELQKYGDSE